MDFISFYCLSIEIIKQNKSLISIKINDVPLQYANALRRICLNGVPIFAIDIVDVIENSSVLADEGIAHRLALIPLKTQLSRFVEPSKCGCNNERGCSNCRVMLVIDTGNQNATRTVMSNELISEDDYVKPISNRIPIVELTTGQRLKVEAYARLGRGTTHAKWNSANISVLTETDNKNEHVLTVESTGALTPVQLIHSSMVELSNRLNLFKDEINKL